MKYKLRIYYFVMPQIPKCGWFHTCEDCDIITSRLMTVKHKKKQRTISVCQKCRLKFIYYLFEDFHTVVINSESAGEMSLIVY